MTSAERLRQRVEAATAAAPFTTYEQVRAQVLAMKDRESAKQGATDRPSQYWDEELSNFEYMLDASPLIVEKLRQHCFHITGIRHYDYRTNKDEAQRRMEEKLAALVELGGEELFVPEPRLLGAFGFPWQDGLFNVDTLKFYESVIALDRAGVLSELRSMSGRRPVVWEIGAGWGGLAYTLKTLLPDATYVITDFPELFLFSATYLRTAFPDARIRFHGEEGTGREVVSDSDFVFVPNTALDELAFDRLDLTVNTVSFQEMTTAQVEAYVGAAHQAGGRHLYSLNRERSHYNRELTSVSDIIERWYSTTEIPVLPVSYTKMLDSAKKAKKPKREKSGSNGSRDAKRSMDYRHLLGTLR